MKIAIINGPNLNLLGVRETHIYGDISFEVFFGDLKNKYPHICFSYFQSNIEDDLIKELHDVGYDHDGIIFNPGGYTNTSSAIGNAVAMITAPVIEVHISNVNAREEFRKFSYISQMSIGRIIGLKLKGYELAVQWFLTNGQF